MLAALARAGLSLADLGGPSPDAAAFTARRLRESRASEALRALVSRWDAASPAKGPDPLQNLYLFDAGAGEKDSGSRHRGAGNRTRSLSHPKRALYH